MPMPPPPNRSIKFAPPEEEDDPSSRNSTFKTQIAKLQQSTRNAAKVSPMTTVNSSSSQSTTSTPMLAHIQSHWPGQTGNGRHLEVRPMALDDLLSRNKIVIPLFQRRYCWTRKQIQQWWHDVSKSLGQHSTHKTMFKRDGDGTLVCIDGQQRLTTTTLLLIALREQARRTNPHSNLIHKIDSILVPTKDALAGLKRWAKYQAFHLVRNAGPDQPSNSTSQPATHSFTMQALPSGWLPPFETTLTPSYIDRAAYFEILCRDYILEELEHKLSAPNRVELIPSAQCKASVQHHAYSLFATQLRRVSNPNMLSQLYRKQLSGFSIMYMELLTDANLQQIFLWMQEKTVFGMGRLLFNPHPGVDFTPIDLARNLVVSSVMNEPLPQQMEFFQGCWMDPLEARFGTRGASQILHQLVKQQQQTDSNERYVGDMEQRLEEYKAATPPQMQEAFATEAPMMVYARFHSHVQERARQLEGGDPNATTRQVADSIVQEMVVVGQAMGL